MSLRQFRAKVRKATVFSQETLWNFLELAFLRGFGGFLPNFDTGKTAKIRCLTRRDVTLDEPSTGAA